MATGDRGERGSRRLAVLAGLLLAAGATACATTSAAAPPAAPPAAPGTPPAGRVGYDRLQQSYAVWQLLDRARDATAALKSWREVDPDSGSSWEYAAPNRTHYRFFSVDGHLREGYESDETDCWRRDDGRWDRRPIGRRPPVAASLADDLFGGAVRIFPEGTTDVDGVATQVVRFTQRAGDRRWSTLANDREVRVWLALDDALPRKVEIATPRFAAPERTTTRLLSHFDESLAVTSPCD
jgi:hypothetical protein